MHRRWIGAVAMGVVGLAWARGAPAGVLQERVERLLADVGPSVPSGYLLDRAIPLLDAARFDGTAAAPAADAATLRQLGRELRQARLAGATGPIGPDAAALRALGRDAGRGAAVPVAVVDARVQRIGERAARAGAAGVRDGRVVLDAGALETVDVFAAAALAEDTRRGATVELVVPRALWMAHGRPEPEAIAVDAADGAGFRPVRFDEPFRPAWDAPGPRTLALRATWPDGSARTAAFRFDVVRMATPAPDDTLLVAGAAPWGGVTATGKAYVALAPGHAALENPVVVVEGFDLDDSMGWDRLYELLNQENLLEDLRAAGFDAVVLDFDSATEPIQRNALVVARLLQDVAAAVDPSRTTFLVGASMGGLCARYALLWLESQAIDARVRTYLSFDSPHGGASIPLGLQYWLDFFSGQSTDAAYLLSRLDTPAARQMLALHHTTPPAVTPAADPLRAALLADFAALGDWPAGPRRIAAANGSGAGAGQGFAPAAQIVQYEYESFLVDITGNVWAVPDGTTAQVFHGVIDFVLLPADEVSVVVSGTAPWDNAPGGNRDSMFQMDTTAAPYGDIVALHDAHCFIPTVSALALPAADLFFDVDGTPDVASLTPFDAVHWAAGNEEHVFISAATKAWVLAEVMAATTDAPLAAAGPAGPPLALRAAFPNPFRDGVTLRFALGAAAPVTLDVYDVAGRLVERVLPGSPRPAGEHAVRWAAPHAGIYFYRVAAGGAVAAGKISALESR